MPAPRVLVTVYLQESVGFCYMLHAQGAQGHSCSAGALAYPTDPAPPLGQADTSPRPSTCLKARVAFSLALCQDKHIYHLLSPPPRPSSNGNLLLASLVDDLLLQGPGGQVRRGPLWSLRRGAQHQHLCPQVNSTPSKTYATLSCFKITIGI